MPDSLRSSSGVVPLQCLLVDDDPLAILVLKQLIGRNPMLHIVGTCSNAVDALSFLRTRPVDVLFLDILMPLLSGIDLLELLLHHLPSQPYTVLVTSSADYAVQAYSYAVVDYLVKPIAPLRFEVAVNKVIALAKKERAPIVLQENFIFVRVGNQFVRVNFADVRYLEADGSNVHIMLREQKLVVVTTLRLLCLRFPTTGFALVHRSFFVNLQFIESIEDNEVLIQQQRLPISARLRPQLLEMLNRL